MTCFWVSLLLMSVASSGCAAGGRRGEIPLGSWSGSGVFTMERWAEDSANDGEDADPDAPGRNEPKSIHRSYPTEMTVRRCKVDGHDVVEVDIRSDHGPIPGMKESTRLHFTLEIVKRVSASTVLYRQADMQFDPKPDQALSYTETSAPTAMCTTAGDATTLEIQYLENYVDVMRFQGTHLEKSGIFFDKDSGIIAWSEQLMRH